MLGWIQLDLVVVLLLLSIAGFGYYTGRVPNLSNLARHDPNNTNERARNQAVFRTGLFLGLAVGLLAEYLLNVALALFR